MGPSSPRTTVLIPVWNAEATLASCLRSVERQSDADFECVVVDDGSTDRSRQIAETFAARDARFRVLAEAHAGLVPSLLKGVEQCRAPLVARLDADDWMHRDRLRLQAEALDAAPALEAVGCFVRIFPRQTLQPGRRRYEEWLHSLRDPEAIWRDRFIECPIAHPTWMIRRRALRAHPYRDRGWPEDYDLLLRLLRQGPKVGIVPHRLVGWRDPAERLSRTHESYAQASFIACRAWHLSRDFLVNQPRYILWGHGRTGRALRRALADLGHRPSRIVDVHPRRIGERIHGAEVIEPSDLARHRGSPIVISVSGIGPRTQIRAALDAMGFREGHDYVAAA